MSAAATARAMTPAAAPPPPIRTRKEYDQAAFRELHESTGRLDFTPVFNPALESDINDPLRPLRSRVLDVIRNQAWGNQNSYAVQSTARTVAYQQADIARRLNVTPPAITRIMKALEKDCYVYRDQGRIYPVPDPDELRKKQSVNTGVNSSSPSLRQRLAAHFEDCPEDRELFNEYFQGLEQIKDRANQHWKAKYGAAGVNTVVNTPFTPVGDPDLPTEAIQAPPILIDNERINESSSSEALTTTVEDEEEDDDDLKYGCEEDEDAEQARAPQNVAPPPPKCKPGELAQVHAAISQYGPSDVRAAATLLFGSRLANRNVEAEDVCNAIHEKAPLAKRNVTGFLITSVPDMFAADGLERLRARHAPKPAAEPPPPTFSAADLERQAANLESFIANMATDHPQRAEWLHELATIKERLRGRKPTIQ